MNRETLANRLKYGFTYILIVTIVFLSPSVATYNLTILHTNDVHDRMEQFDSRAGMCSEKEASNGECYGGVARRATAINDIREREENVLLVDAGDQFQGTNWFYHYRGEATSYFMNKLGYDVQVLGNHEFDNGPDSLAPYLKEVKFPVISTNTDASNEPVIDGLFDKSVILNVGGESIGVVGYTYMDTSEISNSRDVIFNDEIEAVQAEVDTLVSMGINKIIALGHSGITKDLEVAAKVPGIDIIVSGHNFTLLYTGEPPDPADIPIVYGDYPLVVTPNDDPEGTVLIVTDYIFAKYLGRLDVQFDDDGRVTKWSGNPILLDQNIEEDPELLAEINQWAVPIRNLTTVMLGSTNVFLDGERTSCRLRECNMGNVLTDAFISETITYPEDAKWNHVDFAIINSGGIRASIPQGDITFGDVTNVFPFGNTIDTLDLKGRYVREILEGSVAEYDPIELPGNFLQMSGIWVTYDLAKEPYNRVVNVLVRCTNCTIPEYIPLEDDLTYRLALPTFLANGGDGYDVIAEQRQNYNIGFLDSSLISDYVRRFKPLYPDIQRRITFVTQQPTEPVVTKFRKRLRQP